LPSKVVRDELLVDPGAAGDRADPGAGVAVLAELHERRVEDALPVRSGSRLRSAAAGERRVGMGHHNGPTTAATGPRQDGNQTSA
jgi:hypothetical protein